MDKLDIALKAIKDSTNSKGSAEIRNAEIMKTYSKQLEQTKAAAVELQLSLGKIVLPGFKVGLKGLRFLIESFSAVPNPVTAALAAVTLFFGYLAKGDKIIQKISDVMSGGKGMFSEFMKDIKSGAQTSLFVVFGKSDILGSILPSGALGEKIDTRGLKTLTQKGALTKGDTLKDFNSGIGKTMFLLAQAGNNYNQFVADFVSGDGNKFEEAGKKLESDGETLKYVSSAAPEASTKVSPHRLFKALGA